MKQIKKGNYRTRGFEVTEKARSSGAFDAKAKQPASRVLSGTDLRANGGKKRG